MIISCQIIKGIKVNDIILHKHEYYIERKSLLYKSMSIVSTKQYANDKHRERKRNTREREPAREREGRDRRWCCDGDCWTRGSGSEVGRRG
jgi:hypothetical protein